MTHAGAVTAISRGAAEWPAAYERAHHPLPPNISRGPAGEVIRVPRITAPRNGAARRRRPTRRPSLSLRVNCPPPSRKLTFVT